MTEEKKNQIAYRVAKNHLMNTKIPPVHERGKWLDEKSKELGITVSELAEFIQIALTEAAQDVATSLKDYCPSKKVFGYQSTPHRRTRT